MSQESHHDAHSHGAPAGGSHAHGGHGPHGAYGDRPAHGYGSQQHSPAEENKRGRENGEKLFYTLYTVFARDGVRPEGASSPAAIAEFEELTQELANDGVTVRGLYDVSAMRNNADVMVWTHGSAPEKLQEAVRKIRRTALFGATTIVVHHGCAPRRRVHPQPRPRLLAG